MKMTVNTMKTMPMSQPASATTQKHQRNFNKIKTRGQPLEKPKKMINRNLRSLKKSRIWLTNSSESPIDT